MSHAARFWLARSTWLLSGAVAVCWFAVALGRWRPPAAVPGSQMTLSIALGTLYTGLVVHQALYILRHPDTAAEYNINPPVSRHYRTAYSADEAPWEAAKALFAAAVAGAVFVGWPLLVT